MLKVEGEVKKREEEELVVGWGTSYLGKERQKDY